MIKNMDTKKIFALALLFNLASVAQASETIVCKTAFGYPVPEKMAVIYDGVLVSFSAIHNDTIRNYLIDRMPAQGKSNEGNLSFNFPTSAVSQNIERASGVFENFVVKKVRLSLDMTTMKAVFTLVQDSGSEAALMFCAKTPL
jgi:hypothetical protein